MKPFNITYYLKVTDAWQGNIKIATLPPESCVKFTQVSVQHLPFGSLALKFVWRTGEISYPILAVNLPVNTEIVTHNIDLILPPNTEIICSVYTSGADEIYIVMYGEICSTGSLS